MSRAATILELASSVLYHATTFSALTNILGDNEFRLRSIKDNTEYQQPHPGRDAGTLSGPWNFLSTSRSKNNSFRGRDMDDYSVVLVLDGDALNTRYRAIPVDYYGGNPHGRQAGNSEKEDRIFSLSKTIPNAARYIKEIHCYQKYSLKTVKACADKARSRGVPFYFYDRDDAPAFMRLDKSKAVKDLDAFFKNAEVHRYEGGWN